MNTTSARAPQMRIRSLQTIAKAIRRLGDWIAPRNHAGCGCWSKDADIPWQAWPGALAFAAFILFGPEALGWLLRFAI